MIEVIGVRFRPNGKIYFFAPLDMELEVGDAVIVETARGVEYGKIVLGRREIEESDITSSLKPIMRKATLEDDKRNEENKAKCKNAFEVCLQKIAKHGLEMKLIDVEYTFDNNKLLFYFTADGRIDFRELVKDLASVFRTRIELRQIGVRDETKILGGIGICGRELCCHRHLSQNLSLNPTKISGVCGRLMCCLKNEQDTYEYLNEKLPDVGDFVKTTDGFKGEVHSVSVLRQKVKVIVELENGDKEIREYTADNLKFKPKRRRNNDHVNDAELKALEALEKKESGSKL